ncbi:gamma-glutamyl-gamma-aminobutyrate hydrolase [Candidatus Poribacteria bacterium]|nr:MAG: gamma-glutamyl-gamma-aminobutyrate hydrolase [Candidatus Poribacteria bacterium]
MAPIIGITLGSKAVTGTYKNYIRAIEEFGGIPRILYPDVQDAEFADINGLLLTGGPDIDPGHYNETEHETSDVDRDRDKLELRVFESAIEKDIPVFGICRGIQVMNVVIGGSLYQDIPSQFTDHLKHKKMENTDDSWHNIKIQPDSLLKQITCQNVAKVNSRHHQALKVIGDGFVVTAQSEDGIIEGIEDKSKKFMLGVQYHPERMFKTPASREHRGKLFKAFIQAASS